MIFSSSNPLTHLGIICPPFTGHLNLLRDGPETIKQAGVQVLLIDQAFTGVETVAQFLHLPFVIFSNALFYHNIRVALRIDH